MKPYYEHGGISIYHGDCREILPSLPVAFCRACREPLADESLLAIHLAGGHDVGPFCDLLCTDPPYGIDLGRVAHECSGDIVGHGHRRAAKRTYEFSTWDQAPPDKQLLDMILKTATHQIIFGGNYFSLPPSSCWLVWDKLNGDNNFADCELAWTNLSKAVRKIEWLWNGFARANAEIRFDHPAQKPLPVMHWAIRQAPEECTTVFDPFCGTGTTLIAAKSLGKTAIGIEIEEKYCEIAAKRLSQEVFQFGSLGCESGNH